MLTETVNMAHLGARAFDEIGGEVVQTTAFVRCANHVDGYKGTYCRLIEPTTQRGKEELFLAGENRFATAQDNFSKIPGSPIAYWACKEVFNSFALGSLSKTCETKQGFKTGDNERFLRLWHEVDKTRIGPVSYTHLDVYKRQEYRHYARKGELMVPNV